MAKTYSGLGKCTVVFSLDEHDFAKAAPAEYFKTDKIIKIKLFPLANAQIIPLLDKVKICNMDTLSLIIVKTQQRIVNLLFFVLWTFCKTTSHIKIFKFIIRLAKEDRGLGDSQEKSLIAD